MCTKTETYSDFALLCACNRASCGLNVGFAELELDEKLTWMRS